MTQAELSAALKGAREKSGEIITMIYENGSQHVIRPTKAFRGSVRDLCDAVAAGASYKIKS